MLPDIEYHQNRYARALGDAVRTGCRWLDLGAGTTLHRGWIGVPQGELRRRAERIIGIDLVRHHLRENRLLTAAVVGDGGRLPFDDDSFDLVTANMVLEHLPNPMAVLREVARVLRPGGELVCVTPNLGHPVVRMMSLLLSPRWRRLVAHRAERRSLDHIFHTHYRANTPGALERIARAAGLETDTIEVFRSFPMLRVVPLAWLECQWIRLCRWRPLRSLGSNLLVRLRKPMPELQVDVVPIAGATKVIG
jgi:ubiquinone/menaquinone biosynthesis C-methylase UbiE